jgi:hypothetical protein
MNAREYEGVGSRLGCDGEGEPNDYSGGNGAIFSLMRSQARRVTITIWYHIWAWLSAGYSVIIKSLDGGAMYRKPIRSFD